MQNQAVRLVTWNIEKGKRWPLIERCLQHESIRRADVLCLNEVDEGMARSGNLRIAHEIGDRLGMQVVFGRTFKEFTKGIGDELLAPGENTTALQGNATLSRLPILDSKNLLLPACFDHSSRAEKREGNRHVLIVRVDCGSGCAVTIANTHLEVFGTARCRGRQIRFILDHIPAGPAIITGDFNTNTFSRGTIPHTVQSLMRLLRSDVQYRTMNPAVHEPLFDELGAAGFSWKHFNDELATCSVDLSAVEDSKYVPSPIRNFVLSRCRVLPLRLDFICCRGLHTLSRGRTITDLPCQPSDHLPITCDVRLQPERTQSSS
jgi:endonuclease/exonuclease/phosphatase family metal-dependent hydrolase